MELFPTPLRRGAMDVCPGFAAKGPWNRVFLPVFELPDEGLQGLFAGAHRRQFRPSGKPRSIPSRKTNRRSKVPSWIEACSHSTAGNPEPALMRG